MKDILLKFDSKEQAVTFAEDNGFTSIVEEEGEEKVADVKSIHVGIGGDDDAAIAESFYVLFDAEGLTDVVELFVLVDRRLILPIGILGLSFE